MFRRRILTFSSIFLFSLDNIFWKQQYVIEIETPPTMLPMINPRKNYIGKYFLKYKHFLPIRIKNPMLEIGVIFMFFSRCSIILLCVFLMSFRRSVFALCADKYFDNDLTSCGILVSFDGTFKIIFLIMCFNIFYFITIMCFLSCSGSSLEFSKFGNLFEKVLLFWT